MLLREIHLHPISQESLTPFPQLWDLKVSKAPN